eukprot:Clim_evm195s157 gene=Clim_evmTU195s157
MGRNRPQTKPAGRRINRSTKITVEFDPAARRDFILGFRKRKDERRKKAQEKLLKQEKAEKARARAERRENVQKILEEKRGIKEGETSIDIQDKRISKTLSSEHKGGAKTSVTTIETVDFLNLKNANTKQRPPSSYTAKRSQSTSRDRKQTGQRKQQSDIPLKPAAKSMPKKTGTDTQAKPSIAERMIAKYGKRKR